MRIPTVSLLLTMCLGCSTFQGNAHAAANASGLIQPPEELVADGPWKQIAAIETYSDEGSPYGEGPRSSDWHLANRNLVAFLDNRRLLIADGKHPMRVFDVDSGELLKKFADPLPNEIQPRSAAISPDGRYIMILPNREPKIWDTLAGTCVGTLPKYDNLYGYAAFYPDGHRFAVYRGLLSGGETSGNLQVWNLPDAGRGVTLMHSVSAATDARGLSVIYPYLLVEGYRRSQILNADTFDVLLSQGNETDELYLFITPPINGEVGSLATLDFGQPKEEGSPHFKNTSLSVRKETKRWVCPLSEPEPNKNRYHCWYTVSQGHSIVAACNDGLASFFRFHDGKQLFALAGADQYDNPLVTFCSDDVAAVSFSRRFSGRTMIYHILSGRLLGSIPERDPIISPNGRYMAFGHSWVGLKSTEKTNESFVVDSVSSQQQYVGLWKRVNQ